MTEVVVKITETRPVEQSRSRKQGRALKPPKVTYQQKLGLHISFSSPIHREMETISVDITVEYAEVLSLERAWSMVTRVNDVPVGCRVLDQTKVDGECLIWWSPLVGMSPNFLFDQDYQSAETESDANQSIDSCPHPPDQKNAHATPGSIPPGAIDT
ncbi:hypothetical protein An08g11690 [Aspergillus niger]|uniref:Uncharacterized protein n=2 Tax=Aspergillus niger TaxID=5061 RepID=A2QSR7_ASPNC|nr:hypothetical protein An08g11690 [Aspergillus niger]CAK96789.1 hypothetical protein An08g11690 [Aspergillus niger]